MLQDYIEMLEQAEFVSGYTKENGIINYYGEEVEVINVIVPTDEIGNCVIHTFHAGNETLIDVNFKHVCTCHNRG